MGEGALKLLQLLSSLGKELLSCTELLIFVEVSLFQWFHLDLLVGKLSCELNILRTQWFIFFHYFLQISALLLQFLLQMMELFCFGGELFEELTPLELPLCLQLKKMAPFLLLWLIEAFELRPKPLYFLFELVLFVYIAAPFLLKLRNHWDFITYSLEQFLVLCLLHTNFIFFGSNCSLQSPVFLLEVLKLLLLQHVLLLHFEELSFDNGVAALEILVHSLQLLDLPFQIIALLLHPCLFSLQDLALSVFIL